jgi:hypothetical protein
MTGRACRHCGGTGTCDQLCCTLFGYRVTRTPPVRGQWVADTAPACAVCRGTGRARGMGG